MHLMPGTKTGAQISSERRDADRSRDFADGWRYVGGDTGWELIQYAYTMKNGQLEHADSCVRIVSPRLPSDVIEKWRKMNQVEAPTS
jgi:hypothetical protein